MLSALGMLVADVTRDYSASVLRPSTEIDLVSRSKSAPSRSSARREPSSPKEGYARDRQAIERLVDVRYVGQSYEITVPFARDYRVPGSIGSTDRCTATRIPNGPPKSSRSAYRASGITSKPRLPFVRPRRRTTPKPSSLRPATFGGRGVKTAHYRWTALAPGSGARGPAIITGAEATVVVPPAFGFSVDGFGNVIVKAVGRRPGSRRREAFASRVLTDNAHPSRSTSKSSRTSISRSPRRWASRCAAPGFSPNIKERLDYSCAVYDAQGETIAQGDHMPVHLGAMPLSVRAAIDAFAMEPGDVVMLNDPFRGGTHLPDITLVSPVFLGRERPPGFFRRQSRASFGRRRHEPRLDAGRARAVSGRVDPAAGPARASRPDRRRRAGAGAGERPHARRARRGPDGADRRQPRRRRETAPNGRSGTAAASRLRTPRRSRTTPSAWSAPPSARFRTAGTRSRTRSTTMGSATRRSGSAPPSPFARDRATIDFTGNRSAGRRQRERELRDDALGVPLRVPLSGPGRHPLQRRRRAAADDRRARGQRRQRAAARGRRGRQRRDLAADHRRRPRGAGARAAGPRARGEPGHDEQRHARRHQPAHRTRRSRTTRRSAAAWARGADFPGSRVSTRT